MRLRGIFSVQGMGPWPWRRRGPWWTPIGMVITITSRVFNQDAAGAKRAASQGPVFITDRGRPAHVLLSIADLLALPGGEDLELPLIQPSELARRRPRRCSSPR